MYIGSLVASVGSIKEDWDDSAFEKPEEETKLSPKEKMV